jgi:predicted O-methyltransferase YrrM
MGVENAGPLLYSLVRFTKTRTIVEIGAGFTTLWLLQALKDNDDEMKNIAKLRDEGKCTLLDIDWNPEGVVDGYNEKKSSLLCIDNCLHQRQTATGAGAVAKTLGLSDYLKFIKGDAYDMQFEEESIDFLWCDFGVGSRMKDFAKGAWKAIRPGGFLVCHSTLTNIRTREWLEAVRRRANEEETGLPEGEFVEISLLEPQKVYQNSVTILQRRRGPGGEFKEPLYSEYA